MKKHSITRKQMWQQCKGPLTMGLDLGDRHSHLCVLDKEGEVVWRDRVPTTKKSLKKLFEEAPSMLVVMEVGTHSPWVSRLTAAAGHEVVVANPRNVAYITRSSRKTDHVDPESLARLGRIDRKLLSPIRHRSEEAQGDLAVIRARAVMVEARTKLVTAARGIAKAMGERLEKCDADRVGPWLVADHSERLQKALSGLLGEVEHLTATLKEYEKQVAELAATKYPETSRLKQVYGVAEVTSLTYVLTLEDATRFQKSREVGPYLGLKPKNRESGQSKPQLRITKEGDRYLRWLLVQSAQCQLKKNAPDSDLKRHGEKLAARGGKNAKKRAVVAVARKLAVVLHRLWVSGAKYDPLYNAKQETATKAA